MLLNLFLAILLKFISENSEHEKHHEDGEACDGDDDDGNTSHKKDDKKQVHEEFNWPNFCKMLKTSEE